MQDGGRSGCVLHPGDQPTAQTRDQMIDMLRAGGFAAAAVALVAATTFADPSQASKIDMAPAVDALTEHAAATIDAGGLAAGNVNDRAEAGRNGADSSTPADLAAVAGRMVELAGAAVHVMQKHGVIALPVLDAAEHVVGVVHLHDLMRAGAV